MTVLFFALGAIIIFIPYMPSLFEIRKATDAAALRITNHILKDPRSNPELIFWHSAQVLQLQGLSSLKNAASVSTPKILNSNILAVPSGIVAKPPKGTARLISSGSIELSPKTSYSSKILSFGAIKTGAESLINEVHSTDTLIINHGTKVYWWASGKTVVIERDTKLPGKTQATEKIRFLSNSYFQLLEAPSIEGALSLKPRPDLPGTPKAFSNATQIMRFDGDHTIPSGTLVTSTLIVHGKLNLEENTTIKGDVKARGSIIIGKGVQILGNLISDENIHVSENTFISGTVLAKKAIVTSSNVQIGTSDHPITVSGETITFRGSFEVHGMVRAWKTGRIIES